MLMYTESEFTLEQVTMHLAGAWDFVSGSAQHLECLVRVVLQ
jgi:hypothetical protein